MIKTLKKFFKFCGEDNKAKFITSIWLGVISALCSAMRIPAAYIAACAALDGNMTKTVLWTSFGIIVVSIIITVCINMKSTMLQTIGGYRACAYKRIEIAQHMRYLPMGWFNDNSLGNVTNVTTNVLENLANIATRAIMLTTKAYITTAVIVVMLLIFDWRIGLVTIAGLLISMGINALMQRNIQAVSEKKMKSDNTLVTAVLEYVQGIAEIKNYNIAGDSSARVKMAVDECCKATFAVEKFPIAYTFFQNAVNKLTGVAICAASVIFFAQGTLDLGKCIIMLICSFILFEQLDSASGYTALLRTIDMSVNMVDSVLAEKPMDENGSDITPDNCNITLENVSFSYGQKETLRNISLSIPEKTTAAFVGPSGSGKTTLCSLMARFWDVNDGRVLLGGHDVREYSFDSLIRNFSFVFQRTYLFTDTIANNIRFGKPDATMDEIITAAKKACCHEFIMRLPDGYDTMIGEGGASISGGERQRITIARAMLKDAPIIILDEATANVDPENEKELTEAISALTRDKTVIMIAHRLKTVRNADCIFVVDNGQIVQQGTHDELAGQDGIYRKFVTERRQAAGWRVGTSA